MENLESLEKNIGDLYVELYEYTTHILTEKLDYFSGEQKAVNVYKLAKMYNIKIVEKNLESKKDLFSQEVVGYLDFYCGITIYVNEDIGDYTKRYAVAHEIGHYLAEQYWEEYSKEENETRDNVFTRYYIAPRLPKTVEEQACDIIASFLLMPVSTVLDLMEEYIKEAQNSVNQRITIYSLLGYLGGRLHVEDYYTSLCFQNIKYLCAALYERAQKMEAEGMLEADSIYGKIKNAEWLFR